MLIDLTLFVVFVASTFVLWYRVSLKIPQVIAIPDQVITERLHEDSAKARLFILQLKTYYREGQYKPYLWNFLLKSLYRLHLVLLKTDNVVVSYLKSVRIKAESEGIAVVKLNGNGSAKDPEYWQKLSRSQSDRGSSMPTRSSILDKIGTKSGQEDSVTFSATKHTRIEEVKKR